MSAVPEHSADYFEWLDQNPLLQGLPAELEFKGWMEHLRVEPKTLWSGSVPATLRSRLAREVRRAYAPTSLSVHASLGLQGLLYTGLAHRDPRLAAKKRLPYQTGGLLGQSLDNIPWFPTFAGGATLRGMTGCGKTACTERFIARFPQVIQLGRNEECGWQSLKQLVYLVVPMPADNSRGGLLLEIAKKMDAVLETDYETHLRTKYKTVEKGLVAILHWLSLHRCGLLIIEEAQERHANIKVFTADFVTFFLRVLNFEIPVALIGNPLAFTLLDKFSQDTRRFSDGGRFDFVPVVHSKHPMWKSDLFPVVWGFNVFDEPDEIIPDIEGLVWKLTGGLPDALVRLRREAILDAIRLGQSSVTRKNIENASQSYSLAPMRELTNALVQRNVVALKQFTDVPWEYFESLWKSLKKKGGSSAEN